MNSLLALIKNDLRLFFIDRRAMIATVIVPIAMASFFGLIFSSNTKKSGKPAGIAVLVSDDDHSALSEKVVAALQADKNLSVEVVDAATARRLVREGKNAVAVLIPSAFGSSASRAVFSPTVTPPEVTLVTDPSKNAEVQLARGVLLQHLMQTASQSAFSSPEATKTIDEQLALLSATGQTKGALPEMLRSVRNYMSQSPSSDGTKSSAMGMREPCTIKEESVQTATGDDDDKNIGSVHAFVGMGVQGLLFYAMDAALGLLRERRMGLWKRLRAAPLSRATLLVSRLLSVFLVGLLIQGAIFGFGAAFFKLRITGSALGFALLMVTTALTTAAFGLVIASLGKTEAQSRSLSVPVVLGMSFLGGAWFPSFLLPSWVRSVSAFIPTRWAIDGFDAMTWRGLGLSHALFPALALLGFTAAFSLFAWLRFRWEE